MYIAIVTLMNHVSLLIVVALALPLRAADGQTVVVKSSSLEGTVVLLTTNMAGKDTEFTCVLSSPPCTAAPAGEYVMISAQNAEAIYNDCTNVVLYKPSASSVPKKIVGIYCWLNDDDYMVTREPVNVQPVPPRLPDVLEQPQDAGYSHSRELLEKRLLILTADPPIDCGSVEIRQDAKPASECVKRAVSAKQAFIVRYYLQGIDSIVAVGLAGTKSGDVFAVEYDSMGWSPDGLSKRARLLDENHNVVKQCPTPVRLTETPSHRLNCFRADPKAKGNIMSPNLEPY